MPQYMLDTATVSFALRGQGRVAARLLEHRPSQLCISSITLAELRFGAEARRSRKLHGLISTFAEAVAVAPFDQPAADRFAPVAASLARRGEPIGTFDTLMAAEQRQALRARRGAQDRKLGLTSWAAAQQARADRLAPAGQPERWAPRIMAGR